jgi:putative transposase
LNPSKNVLGKEMARTSRIVIAGLPHHVTQRGNRRQQVFFSDEDREVYLQLLKEESDKWGLKIWAYCLMDNHVHLIVVPSGQDSLAKGIGETHKRYTRGIWGHVPIKQ